METPDLLPNRLNFDAIVFCGCTMKEMQMIAIVSLSACIVILGCLTECLFNMFMIGVGLAFPIGVGVAWFIAHIFQRAKQGKPKGFVKQRLILWCEDKNLIPPIYLRRSGKWSVGRKIK
jgi:conjugative transfer region protein (TIGR03750 family)